MRNPNRVYSRGAFERHLGLRHEQRYPYRGCAHQTAPGKLERSPAAPEHIMTKWGGATISSSKRHLRLFSNSSQLRNALAYMVIASLALVFLNIYSASNTRELMFQAKYASMQDKIQVVASSFETADTLSAETVDQVISVLGDINVSRLLITDGEAKVLYDSSVRQNAVGAVCASGGGRAGAGRERRVPLRVSRGRAAKLRSGSYHVACNADRLRVRDGLRRGAGRDHRKSGAEYSARVVDLARRHCRMLGDFSVVSSKRMRKILMSMRLVREGEYSHKIQMRGDDEYTTLATEFNKLTDRLQESEATQRQFVSDASHELKTPLASIKLLSDSICRTIWTRTRCASSSATSEMSQTA